MTSRPQSPTSATVPRSRVRLRDVTTQAGVALIERPSRTIASLLTVVLGISAGVGTLSIAATASHQVSGRFDARRATEVILRPSETVALDPTKTGKSDMFPPDAEQRLKGLNGLRAAGVILAHERSVTITTNHLDDPLKRNQTSELVFGITPGVQEAARAELNGRWLKQWEQQSGARVVVLGRAVAQKLDIHAPDRLVYLDGVPFWVTGILTSSETAPQLTTGVMVSDKVSQANFGEPSNDSYMLLRTAPGAAQVIARQAPIQVLPEGPEDLTSSAPPDPRTLRNEIESDTTRTVITMALVSVLIGAISIANTTLTGIYQRTHEIGLRRALGATPRHILIQTVIETTALGLVAGLVGSFIGTTATLTVALNAGWTPVIDPLVPFTAPVLGALVGAIAGIYPALRAARIEPSTALRSQ